MYLARSGLPAVPRNKSLFFLPYAKSFTGQARLCSSWLHIAVLLFRLFINFDFVSVDKHA